MKRVTYVFIAICFLAVLWETPDAHINWSEQKKPMTFIYERPDHGITFTALDSFFNDLHIGALWFPAISNKGYIGYWDISAFYPGGGNQSNVWQAGMWAGGYVQGRDHAWRYLGSDGSDSDPALYDSLDEQAIVESEDDFGYPYPYRRLTIHVNTALKPYLASEADTVDGDMGLDITCEWHQWGVSGYDHWVIVHTTVVFNKSIDDFYWAWMSDCDVGDVNVPDMYYDDYAGWDDTYRFCYMRDWDYDPLIGQPAAPSTEDSLFLSPGVVGQYLLAAPPAGGPVTAATDAAQKWETKNYWDWSNDVSSVQDMYDRMAGIWTNPFPSPTDFDYRILNGVGPYDVSAGDTAHFWMAYVVGEGYDEDSHATFGLGTLLDHVQDVQAFFDGGMVIPADEYSPRAPDLDPDLEVDVVGNELTVHWDPYNDIAGGATADSFIVYRSTIGTLGPWERVATFDNSVTETQLELVTGCNYVWVQAYDTGNEAGSNPWALSSRLYERDDNGIIRANENTITCVEWLPTATLLHSYFAYFDESSITIEWTLLEAGEDMEFFILRAERASGVFEEILAPDITREEFSFSFRDETYEPGNTYQYRVEVEDESGRKVLFYTEQVQTPAIPLTLYQNYPNPFNPMTEITYYLPRTTLVRLDIFDITGQLVRRLVNKRQPGGRYVVEWDALNTYGRIVDSGIYFYRLTAGKETISKKMVLLK